MKLISLLDQFSISLYFFHEYNTQERILYVNETQLLIEFTRKNSPDYTGKANLIVHPENIKGPWIKERAVKAKCIMKCLLYKLHCLNNRGFWEPWPYSDAYKTKSSTCQNPARFVCKRFHKSNRQTTIKYLPNLFAKTHFPK